MLKTLIITIALCLLFNPLARSALDFDGDNDLVVTTYTDAIGTDDFSISTWVKPGTQSDSYPKWAGMGDTGDGEFMWGIEGTSDFSVYFYGDAGIASQVSSTDLTQGTWAHVVVTKTSSALTQYIDGSSVGSDTSLSGFDLTTTKALQIGTADSSSSRYFNGVTDDFRIYNRALSATEVRAIYESRMRYGGPLDGLVGYWMLDDYPVWETMENGESVKDYSGNGNTGTINDGSDSSMIVNPSLLSYP